ncbi:unnamed protein product, partial [Diatraea saccharalis]
MEFDAIVVKESPGLCRCCLSEGCYKDMGTEYAWMNETEVYADMLLECFDISISQINDGPNGPNRLICEVCITRLRDACYFKKQVLDTEKKFVDMVGRGDFRPKVLYQSNMKTETCEAVVVSLGADDGEVEYLDDEMDYEPADTLKEEGQDPEPTVSADPLPIRGKRGRPKKSPTKPEKKKVKVETKAKSSKALVKGKSTGRKPRILNSSRRVNILRKNVVAVLRYGNVTPFKWHTKGFSCFYCSTQIKDCLTIAEHNRTKHSTVDLDSVIHRIISKDLPVKIDVTEIACKLCPAIVINTCEDLITHIMTVHGVDYNDSAGACILPFFLDNRVMQCVLCESQFDNFTSIMNHMNREHISHSHICQICGLSFINIIRLNRHIHTSHIGFRCTLCDKMFDAYNKLENHKTRMHGQVKTHNCNLCSASLENNYQLKVHMGKVHNVEKYRIECEYCPKVCNTKGAMLAHVQSMHSDLRYECDLCDYTTGIKWLIKLHKRKHFGERDYSCSICEKKFGRSSNVRVHM